MSNLLKINGKSIPKLIDYKVSYCKLWSSDTGRSMTGENKGTLIGIFPKLEITVGRMNGDEASEFLTIVNAPSASVMYYDTEYKKYVTASFYFGDVSDEITNERLMRRNQIKISIIANGRRK